MSASALSTDDVADEWHQLVDLDDWNDVYVVGDVHGCLEPLQRLLEVLDVTEDDLVLFVGDLVRKGPDSAGVLRLVRDAPNMLAVRGNNEEKLLRGEKRLESLTDDDLAYLRSLPVVVSWGDGVVVHGGLDPRKPLGEHSIDDLQTTRSLTDESYGRPFWWESYDGDSRVFFGHTVLEEPVVTEHAVGLDTGLVYGGALTAYDVRRDRVVSVPLDREGKDRKASKIVTPRETVDA